jgi:hypothetical protein
MMTSPEKYPLVFFNKILIHPVFTCFLHVGLTMFNHV